MVDAVRLYFRYLGISLRAQMQYRASFLMATAGRFVTAWAEFFSVWVLFDRFGALEAWRLPEVGLFYGIVNVAFALAEGFGRGFDTFEGHVRQGTFDRILLRPRSTALQIAGEQLQLLRAGRLLQGLVILIWASLALGITWTGGKVLLALLSIVCGACLFLGLFVLAATLAFWTTESLEIFNTVTYGGVETAQYPLEIYRPWFRAIFVFAVPLGAVAYFPVVAILGRPDPLGAPVWFQWAAPLIGVLFLAMALRVWQFGVRHYRSTGS